MLDRTSGPSRHVAPPVPSPRQAPAGSFPWRLRVSWWLMERLTPWLHSSQHDYFERLETCIRPQLRILDIGCGKEFLMRWLRPDLYRRWARSILQQAVIFGIDPHLPSLQQNISRLTVCAFAGQLPFSAASFDLVTANMVVEHLADPDFILREVLRVLKPGGAFLFHTPNLRAPHIRLSQIVPHALKRRIVPFIERRQQDDIFPTEYRLNTREAVAAAAARSGFRLEQAEQVFTVPLTQMFGPLVIFELLLIRLFRGKRFARWRPDLICLLRKPAEIPQPGTLPVNV